MTKTELIKLLESIPDDAPVLLWTWIDTKGHNYSRVTFLNPTCNMPKNVILLMDSGCQYYPVMTAGA